MKVYYMDKDLAIVDGRKLNEHASSTTVLAVLGHKKVSGASEIWTYNMHTRRFSAFKNKSWHLIKDKLAESGIRIRCDAATIRQAEPTGYRFETEKDYFLFKLKYGA